MEKKYEQMKERVTEYFNLHGATIHIDPLTIPDPEGIWEWLDMLLSDDCLDIPGFKIQGYCCSELPDRCIHNYWYELDDDTLTGPQIQEILKNHPLLQQDCSQPKPIYTCHCGSLYITIIGEA